MSLHKARDIAHSHLNSYSFAPFLVYTVSSFRGHARLYASRGFCISKAPEVCSRNVGRPETRAFGSVNYTSFLLFFSLFLSLYFPLTLFLAFSPLCTHGNFIHIARVFRIIRARSFCARPCISSSQMCAFEYNF